jgi:hypothetical protein
VAAIAAVFALSAGPVLASSTTSSTGAVKVKTSLTDKTATETPLIRLGYTLNQGVDLGKRLIDGGLAYLRLSNYFIANADSLLGVRHPKYIFSTFVRLNQAAADYYSVLVGRMRVEKAQQSLQRAWVEAVSTLQRGDEQLDRGITAVHYGNSHMSATGKREIQSALATLRRADSQISHVDALLGIHQSGPTVGLPTKILYRFS